MNCACCGGEATRASVHHATGRVALVCDEHVQFIAPDGQKRKATMDAPASSRLVTPPEVRARFEALRERARELARQIRLWYADSAASADPTLAYYNNGDVTPVNVLLRVHAGEVRRLVEKLRRLQPVKAAITREEARPALSDVLASLEQISAMDDRQDLDGATVERLATAITRLVAFVRSMDEMDARARAMVLALHHDPTSLLSTMPRDIVESAAHYLPAPYTVPLESRQDAWHVRHARIVNYDGHDVAMFDYDAEEHTLYRLRNIILNKRFGSTDGEVVISAVRLNPTRLAARAGDTPAPVLEFTEFARFPVDYQVHEFFVLANNAYIVRYRSPKIVQVSLSTGRVVRMHDVDREVSSAMRTADGRAMTLYDDHSYAVAEVSVGGGVTAARPRAYALGYDPVDDTSLIVKNTVAFRAAPRVEATLAESNAPLTLGRNVVYDARDTFVAVADVGTVYIAEPSHMITRDPVVLRQYTIAGTTSGMGPSVFITRSGGVLVVHTFAVQTPDERLRVSHRVVLFSTSADGAF